MKKKILVVDDSATIRTQIRLALTKEGYDVIDAADGIEGLDRLAEPDVALVICDVNMPRMNGIDMLRELDHRGSVVPVVMLTTEGHPSLVKKARSAGAKGWIVKPFDPALLVRAVRKLAA